MSKNKYIYRFGDRWVANYYERGMPRAKYIGSFSTEAEAVAARDAAGRAFVPKKARRPVGAGDLDQAALDQLTGLFGKQD